MEVVITKLFERDFTKLTLQLRKQTLKQLELFKKNPRHPSLQIKQIRHTQDLFEGRVSKSYRFTFRPTGNAIILRRVGSHDKILKNP